MCPVASFTRYIGIQTCVQDRTCVRIPMCPVELVTGYKPFLQYVYVLKLFRFMSLF